MATGKALNGKPYAGNPHVRFDEGEVAPAATPRRGSLLYNVSRTAVAWLLFAACGYVALSAESPCVNASSFGWNPTNATACLQAAIDSGAKKVVIDRQAGDWIVEPIFLRVSGQEVVVADGVTVRAKKGSFKGRGDCLFRISSKNRGVTLRGEGKATLVMNKRDYQDPENYLFSGWRNAVSIAGSGTTVRDLTILSSGGDGVYVTGAARDVTLENLVSRDHFRQGISVISAMRLRVRHCRFEDTAGAAPQCGVDIEPNRPTDRLEDILFEDCIFDRNVAGGITLHIGGLKRPISITFRRCVARGNNTGISVHTSRKIDRPTTGTVLFEDCTVSGNSSHALRFCNQREGGVAITVRNCSFDARGAADAPVLFDNRILPANVSGVTFDHARLIADVPAEKAFAFVGIDGTGIVPGGLKGSFTLERSKAPTELLDLEAFAKRHPSNPEKFAALLAFSTREVDWRGVVAQSGAQPLERPASTGWLRGSFTFVQAFPAAGDYPVVFRTQRLGNRRAAAKVQMRDAAGTDLGTFTIDDCETVTNVIHAHSAGIRRYEIICGLAAVESRWPGQGVLADFKVPLYGGRNRRFYFTVPAEAESVSVQVRPVERCSAKLMRPDGTVMAESPYEKREVSVLTAPREKTAAPEVWSVVFPQVEEDAQFRIGAPALPIVATGSPDMAPTMR